MIKMLSLLAPAFMLILSGCSLAPDYQRPEMDIPGFSESRIKNNNSAEYG